MNKNTLILLFVLGILITFFSFKTYKNIKQEAIEKKAEIVKLETKIKEILEIKNKYPKNPPNLAFCKFSRNDNIKLICKNLNKNQFARINEILKRYKIKSFDIEKNKGVSVSVEIME